MPILQRIFGNRRLQNRALEAIISMPRTPVTEKLISALPGLAKELYSSASNQAKSMGSGSSLLAECTFDLELAGGFESIVGFAGSAEVASLFADAIVYQATGKEAGACPGEWEYLDLGTTDYRGIAKYAEAEEYFKVADPAAWLFGKEYSKILSGNAKDFAFIASVLPYTILIRKHGAWIIEHALTGRVPSKEEQEKLSAFVDQGYRALSETISRQGDH